MGVNMSKDSSRRTFLGILSGAAATCFASRAFGSQQQNPPPNMHSAGGTAPPNYGQGNVHGGGNGNGPGGGINGSSGAAGGPQPVSSEDTNGITPGKNGGKNPPPTTMNTDLRSDARNIRVQVNQLAQQVSQLKAEIEKTDATKVLSLDIIRKTKDIEKLAHYIASLEKG